MERLPNPDDRLAEGSGAGPETPERGQLRIALTIAGAASLGAYEGGALAALLRALAPLWGSQSPRVRIDAIGGASAGSITGLLAARCITTGIDPVEVMKTAWVESDSVHNLLQGYEGAPFSTKVLKQMAKQVLGASPSLTRQEEPVRLVMTAVALRGFEYEARIQRARPAGAKGGGSGGTSKYVTATTFLDFFRATVHKNMTVANFEDGPSGPLIDMALASGANEFGFPSMGIDRSQQRKQYAQRGLKQFPSTDYLWYTDGGTLDNEPLGHTLDLTTEIDAADSDVPFERLHILVHPHSAAVPTTAAWADPGKKPTWSQTLSRATEILLLQGIYDDLRHVAKTNTRIGWFEDFVSAIGPIVQGLPARERNELMSALTTLLSDIAADRRSLPGHQTTIPPSPSNPIDLLQSAVAQIAGVEGKRQVDVGVILPKMTPSTSPEQGARLLAGKALADFGGFLDAKSRGSDFDLGYQSTLAWIDGGGLAAYLTPAEIDVVQKSARAAHKVALPSGRENVSGVRLLSRHPLSVLRLLARFGRVGLETALRPGRRQP